MNNTRPSSILSLGLTLTLLVIAWMLFAPVQLGGRISFVVINGNSMEPVYVAGDLVVVRAADSYHVGDITTYRHPEIGPVIHRIIGRNGERWVFKGDNNTFIDPYQPRTQELIGRAILHIPVAGKLLTAARDPRIITIAVFCIGLFVMQRFHRTARSRQSNRRATRSNTSSPAAAVVACAALVALLALGCTIWVYIQPASRAQNQEFVYNHTGEFHYQASAPDGIYDTNMATTGQPIFWQLSNQLDVAFEYHFQADVPATLSGTSELEATVSSADGWQRTLALSPEQPFSGTTVAVSGTIDLAQVRALIHDLEERADLPRREYLLAIAPKLHLAGVLMGEAFQDNFAPRLVLRSDEFQLQLVRDADQNPIVPTKGGVVNHTILVDQAAFPGLPTSIETARITAPLILLMALLVAAGVGYPLLRDVQNDQAARIRLQYGSLIADAATIATQPRNEITIASIDALARIAERHGTLIIHNNQDGIAQYAVFAGETMYSYQILAVREPTPKQQTLETSVSETAHAAWHSAFLGELELSGHASQACRAVGISITDAYHEREADNTFAQAWDAARERAYSQVKGQA